MLGKVSGGSKGELAREVEELQKRTSSLKGRR